MTFDIDTADEMIYTHLDTTPSRLALWQSDNKTPVVQKPTRVPR